MLSLPVAFFSQRYTGDLVNRVEANDRVATLLARDFGNAAASCLTAVFLGVVMIFYDVTLAAIVLGSAALNVVVAAPAPPVAADVALRLQMEQAGCSPTSVVGLQSIETLKATGGENDFFSQVGGLPCPGRQLRAEAGDLSAGHRPAAAHPAQPDLRRRARRRRRCRSSTGT